MSYSPRSRRKAAMSSTRRTARSRANLDGCSTPKATRSSCGNRPNSRRVRTANAISLLSGWKRMKKPAASEGQSASALISEKITSLGDWRGETLARMRGLIQSADPDAVEEWKWMGTPVWSHDGIICTGESYKSIIKLTFMKGAKMKDPKKLFNSRLEGNVRRAIDIHEGEKVDASAFKALIRAAIALNTSGAKR